MADPFSAVAGALSVADICVRVGKYLHTVNGSAKRIDRELEVLELEINNFKNVYTALERLCDTSVTRRKQAADDQAGVEDPTDTLWRRAADLVKEGHDLVQKLQDLLLHILGHEHSPKSHRLDDLRKAVKLLHRDREYEATRQRFKNLNMELNTMLTAIDLTSSTLFQTNTSKSLDELPTRLSQPLQELGLQLKAQIAKMESATESLEPSILSAKAAVTFTSLNEHYYVQKPDTSIWTGRAKYLAELREALLSAHQLAERKQRRFVVYGISGAGKTQLCCKFAQDYRESFWGIFWIDASSPQNATESWKKIAKLGGRDGNEEAGKHWLSNLQSPWLLIIDGADVSEEAIRSQFPSGDRGCVLVTTRNPRLKINATVGDLSLDRLEEEEANDLLHKATKHEPWDVSARKSASSIAKHLGYLPLALIHAGRAIYHQLCTLQGYIPFFDRTLNDFKSKRTFDIAVDDEDSAMGAFTSFDIIYSGLEAQADRETAQGRVSRDAVELVNVFAFLHSNDICLETLIRAGHNLQGEAPGSTEDGDDTLAGVRPMSASRVQRMKIWAQATVMRLQQQTPVLPKIFGCIRSDSFDESRVRRALDRLVRMSLLAESSENGSYSMHPLVHVWVRKRLSTAAQALWSEAAANMLATSVKLTSSDDESRDQDYYRRILPHVNEVRTLVEDVKTQLTLNRQQSTMRSFLRTSRQPSLTSIEVSNFAKYSRVYMECANFQEAELLLRRVLLFVTGRLGIQHPLTTRVQMGLAAALWHLGRAAEAQELQELALQTCRHTLGDDHPHTLRTMDALGHTCWQRGLLKDAKAFIQEAIRGMEGKPKMFRDRMNALNHLGNVYTWYTEFDIARELHQQAFAGLTERFSDSDSDAMAATAALAMTLLQFNSIEDGKRAYELMEGVYQRRERKLGREHAYTLLALCDFARTTATRGSRENNLGLIKQAKCLFRTGLEIAERNLGADHIGTLMGRQHLASALVLEKNYDVAEREFKDIAKRQKHAPGAQEGTHRDRMYTLRMLFECYELQGRYEEALEVLTTLMSEFALVGEEEHPWRLKMQHKHAELLARVENPASDLTER